MKPATLCGLAALSALLLSCDGSPSTPDGLRPRTTDGATIDWRNDALFERRAERSEGHAAIP